MTNSEFWELESNFPMVCSISSDCSTMTFKMLKKYDTYFLVIDDANKGESERFEIIFCGNKNEFKEYLESAIIPEHSARSLLIVLEEN